jgi:enamine deaminase RidA (YjgF/YER057c/UK114 family)
MMVPERSMALDGTGFEERAGYARAVRVGAFVVVSGTTANNDDGGALHPGDTAAQTESALLRALAAAARLGAERGDVVRTRLFLAPGADWSAAAAAHRKVFGDVRPANTLVYVHALVGDEFLVEAELDAIIAADRDDRATVAD